MKKLLALLIALMTVLLCSCSSGGETIRFGAAGTGGIYNEAANSIKSIADADGTLKIETKTTAGSAANVRLLSQNYLDAAIVQSDIAHDAFNGENNFEKSGSLEGYSAVVGMFTEACHIVVRKDSDINSVDDLLGKTVSIGEEESGSELNAKQILSAYGLNSKMVKEKNLNYADAAKQLQNGEIDAAFFTLGLGIASMEIFGSYMNKDRTLYGEAVQICALDTFVAIVAGLIIFPACFSFGVQPDQGPALIFVTLPNVFVNMTGGRIWGTLFFLFMTFASFSTVIAVFENLVAFLTDTFGMSRTKASIINGIIMFFACLPCIFGFNIWKDFNILGKGVLDLEDFVVSNLLLPIGAMVYLLFCTTKFGWGFDNYFEECNTGKGLKLS